MEITAVISIAISIAAFILSATALWQTHFAKFKAVCSAGNLQFKIYPFTDHYLPSVDIPITITNVGARAGKVVGLRIRVRYPDLPTRNNFEFFSPQWDVDYKIYNPISNERFEWFDKAIIGEWMPFIVLPKQTVTKHLIFESNWDEPIFQDKVIFELEIYTSTAQKWQQVARWDAFITPTMLDENIDSVSSFTFTEASSEKINLEEDIDVTELHNQINTEYLIETGIFQGSQSKSSQTRKKEKNRKKL